MIFYCDVPQLLVATWYAYHLLLHTPVISICLWDEEIAWQTKVDTSLWYGEWLHCYRHHTKPYPIHFVNVLLNRSFIQMSFSCRYITDIHFEWRNSNFILAKVCCFFFFQHISIFTLDNCLLPLIASSNLVQLEMGATLHFLHFITLSFF